MTSPQIVKPGDTLRILAASEIREEGVSISITGPSGDLPISNKRSGGGPPFWWSGETKITEEGTYVMSLVHGRKSLFVRELSVPTPKALSRKGQAIWDIESDWNRATENLYSAWIDSLFHEADESTSWKALHEVT